MTLDFYTSFVLISLVMIVISFVTLFFSLSHKENRSFLWAAAAGFLFSLDFILGGLRNVIPDLYSIVVFNVVSILAQLFFCELYSRILGVLPRKRRLLLLLPLLMLVSGIWFTYFKPSFALRVISFNILLVITIVYLTWVIVKGANKGQLHIHFMGGLPFYIIGILGLIRIFQSIFRGGIGPTAFDANNNLTVNIIYLMYAIWATLSAIFLISNKLRFLLEESARIDPLTSILNRRVLQQTLTQQIVLSRNMQTPLGLIICDIDHFKRVNDSHGHLVGDEVLVHTVNVFKECLRSTDFIARYGGEEFIFALPSTNRENTAKIAERLRESIKAKPYTTNNITIPISVSFGVTDLNLQIDMETDEDLIRRADAAMYEAKGNGRDQVIALWANQYASIE